MIDGPDTTKQNFAAAMAVLGPLGAAPRLAVAVSGGGDSMALALLAHDWVAAQGGSIIALIVDHGLRSGSDREADLTASRLAEQGIENRILSLTLAQGAALQERARAGRHAILASAAREHRAVHLLLGHQADDQAELIAMRAARGPRGLFGMSPIGARNDVLLLRPLLDMRRADLRDYLRARKVAWIEDPSNLDSRFERGRLRLAGGPAEPADAAGAIARASAERASELQRAAAALASSVTLDEAGFARIAADRLEPEALAALLRVIGGADYPPSRASTARLARSLTPATLGGAAIIRERRPGGQFLMIREPAACARPVPAMRQAQWDGRFVLDRAPESAIMFGALGRHSARLRDRSPLPAAVLRGLPALFDEDTVLSVPHLGFGPPASIRFVPGWPALADPGYLRADRLPSG